MKALLALLLAVFVLGATAAAGYLVYKQQAAKLKTVPAPASQSAPKSVPKVPANTPIAEAIRDTTADPETLGKLATEIKKTPDTVGWLQLPGTDIDSSVVQYHNNSYYLRRDERKKDDIYGCYFADYECSVTGRELLSQNTVIYGHSDLKDNPEGPRFSQLFRLTDDAFAEEHQTILLTTPEETLEWEIFAVLYTDVTFDYIKVNMSEAEMMELTTKALSLSVRNYGILPTGKDKIITLSTCSVRDGNDGNHRFVVMGRLKPTE